MNNHELLRFINFLEGWIKELQGLELLDYHNKNHLVYDNKRLSEVKQELIGTSQQALRKIKVLVERENKDE